MTPAEIEEIIWDLEARRCAASQMPAVSGPGVYAFFLEDVAQLDPITITPVTPL